MRIAIPSYQRSETLNEKTLNYLINVCLVDPKMIDVFLANETELLEYQKHKIHNVNLIVGKETLKNQRNFIDFFYPENERILCFDDDVITIHKKVNDKKTIEFTSILKLAEIGFEECRRNHTKIWGICAVLNPFYMANNVSTNLKYIEGAVFGQIITHDKSLSVTLEDKEDFERTILYFDKYKKIIRFNGFAMKSNFYIEKGGMQITRTPERITASAKYLANKYPEYCEINTNKKSEHTEIKLNSRAK